jgi:probable phosphoglycerate mutase
MTTLLLIRHAETDAVGKVLAGRSDRWRLNEAGKRQAACLAERLSRLPITAIYTSPLPRTVESAQPLADKLGLPLRTCNALTELDYGAWQDQSFADLDQQPEWTQYHEFRSGARPPGGESMLDVQTRMIRAVEAIRQEHEGAVVGIVSHAEPIRVLLAYCLGIALDLTLRLEISPASVSILRISGRHCSVACLNATEEFAI